MNSPASSSGLNEMPHHSPYQFLSSSSTLGLGQISVLSSGANQANSVLNQTHSNNSVEYIKSALSANQEFAGSRSQSNKMHSFNSYIQSVYASSKLMSMHRKAIQACFTGKVTNNLRTYFPDVKSVKQSNQDVTGNSQSNNNSLKFCPSTFIESPVLTAVTSSKAVQSGSVEKKLLSKDLNVCTASKKSDLKSSMTNPRQILKSNQEVIFCSDPTNINRRAEKRSWRISKKGKESTTMHLDVLTQDTKCTYKRRKRAFRQEIPNIIDLEYDRLFNADLLPNVVKSICSVCFQDIKCKEGVTLRECLHSFCKKCLTTAIETSEDALVKCPFEIDKLSCKKHLQEREVKALVTGEVYEKYLQRSISLAESQAENSFHCQTPDCPGWCFFEDDVDTFLCPVCDRTNCLICAAIHEGQDCSQYQNDVASTHNTHEEARKTANYSEIPAAEGKAQDGFQCQTPDCPGWCSLEDGVSTFLCPVCDHANCLICVAIHEGRNCSQYQDDVASRCNTSEDAKSTTKFVENELLEKEFEEKETYHNLIVLDGVDLVTNAEKFECPVCFENIDAGQGVTLQDCLHSFCKECLTGVVRHCETATVKCPFQNDVYICESELQEREVRALVSPEVFEKYLQRSISLAENQAENSFHCKTPDCRGWCFFEDDVNSFLCPICKHTNCLTCAAIHEEMNCRQYQEDVAFRSDTNPEAKRTRDYLQKMLKKGQAMKCPKCQIILMKKYGCDGVQCTMCRTEICWATRGPRWGPNGRGDISGGCRCGENGKRCHPKCKNCH